MRYKRYAVLAVCLILLLGGMIYGCRKTPTEPPPTPTPTTAPPTSTAAPPTPTMMPTSTPTRAAPTPTSERFEDIRNWCEEQSNQGFARLYDHPEFAGLLYRVGQVIVTGDRREVDQVAEIVGLGKSIAEIDLDQQGTVFLYQTVTDQTELQERHETITDLAFSREVLETGIDWTVHQATCEINVLGASLGVSANPNYLLSPAQWIGAGSPWTQNGGWSGGLDGGGLYTATVEAFWEQWAFGPDGIHLFQSDGTRWGPETGKGTRIAIFDTSPFEEQEETWINGRCIGCSIQDLTGDAEAFADSHLRLNVWHPSGLDGVQTCPGYDRNVGKEASLEGQDISNHGLFVAGLAHAVAPSSELYLIRVLEDDGCGTLYQIMQGIRTFMDEMAPKTGDTLVGTILNLSFGLHKVPEEAGFGLPCGGIESFESLLREADKKGATIVAAAGNDSYLQDPSAPRAMELPAGYPFVVGVAASNRDRWRGCFSNGDMVASSKNTAAPGGNGEEGEELGEVLECAIPKCSEKNPNPCLVSMVYRGNPGYAYWVGTSFAAPLVSGQRALLIERVGPQEVNAVCLTTDETLPDGIINWATVLGIDCPQN